MRGSLVAKFAICIGFTLLLAASALAETKLLDKDVYPLETWEFEDNVFFVNYNWDANKVFLTINNEPMVLAYEECKFYKTMRICWDSFDDETDGVVKFIGGQLYPAIGLAIYEKSPEIVAKTTFTKTSDLEWDDEILVTTRIANEGDKEATNFNYSIGYPSWLNLRDRSRNIHRDTGNDSTYDLWFDGVDGRFPVGHHDVLNYRLKVRGFGKWDVLSNISYKYEGGIFNESTSDVTLDAALPFKFEASLKTTEVDVKEVNTLQVDLENLNTKGYFQIENVTINFSDQLEIVTDWYFGRSDRDQPFISDALTEFQEDGQILWYNGSLKAEKLKSFYFDFRAKKRGTYNITINGTIVADNTAHKFGETIKVIIKQPGVLKPKFSLTETNIRSYAKYGYRLYVSNSDELHPVFNITTTMTSVNNSLFKPMVIHTESIGEGRGKEILEGDLLAPPVGDIPLIFPINYTIVYHLDTRERKEVSGQEFLTVNPLNGSISVDYVISEKGIIQPGTNMTIEVKVRNLQGDKIKSARVIETIPKTVKFVGGRTAAWLSLDGGKEENAYLYKVYVPLDFADDNFTIATKVSFNVGKYLVVENFNRTLEVNKTILDMSLLDVEEEVELELETPAINETNETELTEEELKMIELQEAEQARRNTEKFKPRKGVIEKIIDFFGNLF